jgi:hypothetical protein
MATDLTAHQTRGAAPIRWIYDPDKADEREAFKRSLSGGGGSSGGSDRKRPDWMDNPPEGFRVSTATSPDLQVAINKAGSGRGGGQQKWVEAAPDGQFIAHVLMPISPAEAAPRPAVEADPPLLDDYEQPTLDPVDLDLDLDEEEEGLTIEPAVREPALDYALGEEEGKGTASTLLRDRSPVSRSLDLTLQEEEEIPSLEQSILEQEATTTPPASTSLLDRSPVRRGVPQDIADAAAAANRPQAALQDNTGTQDTGYLYDQGKRISQAEAEEILGAEVEGDDPLLPGPISLPVKAAEEEEAVAVAAPTIAEAVELPEDAGPGLLDRLAGMGGKIGQLARENPDLVLQGLRTIGELGGEYKRGRREQEAADRMAEEARMGTAISALTRGRVNPTVTPRMPRTSAGEGMFDVLAGIGRGGQEFMGQKRALEEQERLEGIEDETLAAERAEKDRRFGLDKYRAETERMAVAGKDPEGPEGEKAEIQAQKVDDAQMIMAHVSGLLETFDRGGPFTTGALAGAVAGERNYDPFGDAPAVQQEYDSQKIVLFEFVKRLGDLGRLSDKDVELIERTLPDKFTGKQRLQGAYNGIAKVLSRSTKGAFEAGPSPFEEGYDPERNMRLLRMGQATSPQAESISEEEQEELVERAEEGDAEAIAELQRHGLI